MHVAVSSGIAERVSVRNCSRQAKTIDNAGPDLKRRTVNFNGGGSTASRNSRAIPGDPRSRQTTPTGRRYVVASWLALSGLVIPAAEGQIFIADTKFTAGRIAMIALVIPAIMVLARRGRRLLTCDIATALMVGWMLAAASVNPGSLSSPVAV